MKHYVIAGSGIVGCVIARKLADKGNKVTIYERRSHAGGNLYDCVDEHGIRVHLYGPHIFHTNSQRVYDLVNSFCELQEYNLVCGSVMDGKCVPTAFDFTSVDTFFPDEAETIKEHIRLVFGDRESATVLEMLDSEDENLRISFMRRITVRIRQSSGALSRKRLTSRFLSVYQSCFPMAADILVTSIRPCR